MTDNLRHLLGRAVDHAVAYRAALGENSGKPEADYYQMREALKSPLPEVGNAPEAVLEELIGRISPGLMPMAGPRFFGFVIGASHPAGVAADWMVTAWGQNAGYHTPTPGAAAIEEVAEAWLLDILDLPRESSIGFVTGATVANAVGLAAARTRVLLDVGWDVDADGLFGAPEVAVLVGDDAHSSVFSALQMLGFGYRRVHRIATDDQGRMRPEALATVLETLSGPKIVIAQAGQINTGAYDRFTEIVAIAHAHGAWVHVDGAFGLWARATASHKHLTEGIEGADSWVTDGHKWLQVPYDSGFAIVRDREAHQRAMTQWGSYLPSINPGDRVPSAFVPELSRRARGIPVWAMLKTLGRDGVAALVERHCAYARRFAERLDAEPGINLINIVTINQVIVNFGDGDAESRKASTEAVIARVQQEGICFVGGAAWHGEWVLRISVSSGETAEQDVDRSADAIINAWRAVQAAGN
ncbi:MAG: aspartate aminotransferase family protein [Devosia sp.]|nr:aspartate aminotransferase family protein [Devosia sp.]